MKSYKAKLILGASILAFGSFSLAQATKAQGCMTYTGCYVDLNGNGVVDAGEPTVPNANCSMPNACPPNQTDARCSNTTGGSIQEHCCFIAGTKVAMADGSDKNIEDIEEGDQVLGFNNAVHTVTEKRIKRLADRTLIAINGGTPFATRDHTFKTANGWASADPDMTEERYPSVIEDIGGRPDELAAGTVLLTKDGTVSVTSVDHKEDDEDLPVYDLEVDGDHTYMADGYVVHNCGAPGPDGDGFNCFFLGTKILMADGSLKNIEDVREGDVTAAGKVHQVYARYYDYAHHVNNKNGSMLYDGIYVTGLHAVFDGEQWIESHDLKKAIPVNPPNGEKQTYNMVTEDRLIPVMGKSGLHYFADNLNNLNGVSEESLKIMMQAHQQMA